MNLSGSIKAFERAKRTTNRAYDVCSELLQRTDLATAERERIDAFRDWVAGHSLTQFDADGSNLIARNVRDRAVPFLAEFGIDEPAITWI